MQSEDSLISRIAETIGSRAGAADELRLGIGDDGAVVRPARGKEWVLSCDLFLEGIHFRAETHRADSVGYKALARATSDLAAMGAAPRFFLLALALPKERTERWLDEFLGGIGRAAKQLGMQLAGGDTTRSDTVFVSITVLGEVEAGRGLTRSGAQPGDLIYVSGRLGGAKLGLDLVLSGAGGRRSFSKIVQPHLYPRIRVPLGRWLSKTGVASAAIDISDGLSTDLTRLAEASKVGAVIQLARIPGAAIPEAARRQLKRQHLVPWEMALHGGEDYELLFTVPRAKEKLLRGAPEFRQLRCIGEITRGRRVVLVDFYGKPNAMRAGGWDPFRG
jgi:thiamine-monophosphate kinase